MDIGEILCQVADGFETARVTDDARRVKSPPIPANFSKTERVIAEMMRENMGASILDSGGAYGRSWQRALTRDFSRRERASLRASVWVFEGCPRIDLDLSIDLHSYLSDRLDYDASMTATYKRFARRVEHRNSYVLEIMEAFPKFLEDVKGFDVREMWCENSCNQDNLLSGAVQFVQFAADGTTYVALQIHGGCDLRGGYTSPKLFACDDTFGDWNHAQIFPDWSEIAEIQDRLRDRHARQPFLFDSEAAWNDAEIETLGDEVWWDYGSYDDHGEACKSFDEYEPLSIESRSEYKRGRLCVLPDHRVLCPVTGAVLLADF
jgi:hypothetical protein